MEITVTILPIVPNPKNYKPHMTAVDGTFLGYLGGKTKFECDDGYGDTEIAFVGDIVDVFDRKGNKLADHVPVIQERDKEPEVFGIPNEILEHLKLEMRKRYQDIPDKFLCKSALKMWERLGSGYVITVIYHVSV